MPKFILFLGLALSCAVNGQNIVNRVRVREHQQYMVDVIQEVVKSVEENGWWNLKLLDIHQNINETILTRQYEGTVTYKNGYVVGIHSVDVRQDTLNQIWAAIPAEATTQVTLRGQLRMTDVSLGYDIEATLNGQTRHYTGIIIQPMVTFDFSVIRNVNREEFTDVTVVASQTTLAARRMEIRPSDRTAGALTALFDRTSTLAGVRTWESVFQHIAWDAVRNRVKFPGLCFNCVT